MTEAKRVRPLGLMATCAMLAGIAHAETAGPIVCGGPVGSCYQVFLYDVEGDTEAEIGWEVARASANEKLRDGVSGRLATITSADEDEFIRQLAVDTFTATGFPPAELWVGGFQSPQGDEPGAVEPAGNWQWINGEGLFLYTNWDDAEPNDLEGEEHLGIGRQGFDPDQYGWNDEGFLANIGGYVVEFGAWFPQENAVVFPPSPQTQLTAVAQEVVQAGTFQQFSCVLTQPVNSTATTNLVSEIRKTPGCAELAARLPLEYKASLLGYQRAFATIVDENGVAHANTQVVGTGKQAKLVARFVVTLVLTRDLQGRLADLTNGVVLSQEEAATKLSAEPTCNTAFVDNSPTTVAVTVSELTTSGDQARNLTVTCNRTRSAVRYSDTLYAYPIRNVSPITSPPAQVLQEAADLRQTFSREITAGCVNVAFLKALRKKTDAAVSKALSGNRALVEASIAEFEAATLMALGTEPDPYGSCPREPKGEIGSRLLALTFQVHRGLLFPNIYVMYVIPDEIKALLPPFPGDVVSD